MSFDINEAHRFLNLLTGNSANPNQWQVIHDQENDSFPTTFYDTLDNAVSRLQSYQQQGYGVFITINETDGTGRELDNIIDYRACFADVDGDDLPTNIPDIPHF